MKHLLISAAVLALPSIASAADQGAPHVPENVHETAFVLALRGGIVAGNGDLPVVRSSSYGGDRHVHSWTIESFESEGTAISADAGYRFARDWTLFAGYELGQSTAAQLGSVRHVTHAPHLGIRLTTNRKSVVGLILEMGAGYRFMQIERDGSLAITQGFEPLRAGVGLTFRIGPRFRLNAMCNLAVGQMTSYEAFEEKKELTGGDRRFYAFRSATLGGTIDF